MKVEWLPIGLILELQRRGVEVMADQGYQEIGVRSFGKGLFIKEPVVGAELGNKRVFKIRTGDFIVSNVFAWEGAVGVAGLQHDGLIGSHRFMTWTPRQNLNLDYLRHYFGSDAGVASLASASPGSAGRNRTLSITNFEHIIVPLPPRSDQDRIAAHLSRLLSPPSSARLDSLAQLAQRDWPGEELMVADVVEPISRREQPRAECAYPMRGVKWYGEGLFTREVRTGSELTGSVYRIEPGDLVYNRLFAWKQSFALATATGWASSEFPTFRVNAERVSPRILLAALLSPKFTAAVNAASTGSTPTSRNRLKERDFLSLPVAIPRQADQGALDAALNLVDRIRPLARRSQELAAGILPAARNEIFSAMR